MNERDMLLRRLSSAQFAAWEMHVYLDTHPNDSQAMAAYEKYALKAQMLKKEYEDKYGPLNVNDLFGGSGTQWLAAPWPWDVEEECEC